MNIRWKDAVESDALWEEKYRYLSAGERQAFRDVCSPSRTGADTRVREQIP